LKEGIGMSYSWFLGHLSSARGLAQKPDHDVSPA
jgi:hypothetical protein